MMAHFQHMVQTDHSPYADTLDVYNWCQYNCNDKWTDSVYFKDGFGKGYERLQFSFENENEAVLFKLRWG